MEHMRAKMSRTTMRAVPTRATNGPLEGVICSIESFSRTVVAPHRALARNALSSHTIQDFNW
jgi:hypothetical protein